MKSEKVKSNTIEIYYEAFGSPADPAVLLVAGMDDQCTLWVPYFYQPIVDAGFYVIRFDNRDCGLTQWIHDWDPEYPYTLEDMADDTIGLMDALSINRAHIIGASMGGMIAQRMAISRPERVLTLTSMASSGYPADPDPDLRLPENIAAASISPEDLRARYPGYLTDAGETIEYRVEALKVFAGSRFPFDEDLHRRMQTYNIIERKGYNPEAAAHQAAAVIASGSRLDEMEKISAPCLILHGTEDTLVPPAHAVKYAALIPHAKLVWMAGVGHELPEGIMGLVHREILDLIKKQ